MERVDVVIIGGGMVGLALAQLLTQANFSVMVIEAKQTAYTGELTARVSAINQTSIQLLKKISVWSSIKSKASLQRLTVWDDLGGGEINFDAAAMNLTELGFIVDNQELVTQLAAEQAMQFIVGDKPQQIDKNDGAITLVLQSGKKIKADLCVGADGANSWLRQQMKVALAVRPYHHQAIIAVVETEKPHQNTGWQNFLRTGPLALLPLVNAKQCAIVWSVVDSYAKTLAEMDELEFECELNNAFGGRLGLIRYLGDRRTFPLIKRHAKNYVQPNLALVGDAAHTIHPLAGQGVNLGFSDVAKLADSIIMARQKHQAIGGLRALRRYERARRAKNTEMIVAMRGFYELFSATNPSLVQLRSQGFNLVDRCDWLKKIFIEVAT